MLLLSMPCRSTTLQPAHRPLTHSRKAYVNAAIAEKRLAGTIPNLQQCRRIACRAGPAGRLHAKRDSTLIRPRFGEVVDF
jgi:hypothetical protein